jgi:hypothetical protein
MTGLWSGFMGDDFCEEGSDCLDSVPDEGLSLATTAAVLTGKERY